MRFIAKKYLISLYLLFALVAQGTSQEKSFPFTWLDRDEKRMAGALLVNLLPAGADGLYHLSFSVTWFNQDGNPIRENPPFLCLSKYDLDLFPQQKISCVSFDQKRPFNLIFQGSDKLDCRLLPDYQGFVRITARFQYALTRELYEIGRSELIDINGRNSLTVEFVVRSEVESVNPRITADTKRPANTNGSAATLLRVSESFRRIQSRVQEMEDKKTTPEAGTPDFLENLEVLSAGIGYEKSMLNSDSLPTDSFQLYRERYNHLNDVVLDMRAAYLRFRLNGSKETAGVGAEGQMGKTDSLRNIVRLRFELMLQKQVDSLRRLSSRQKMMATELSELLINPENRRVTGPRIDTILTGHNLIKKEFQNLILSHERTWQKYRLDLNGFAPIREIENLHGSFLDGQSDLQSAFDQVDRNLNLFDNQAEIPWYQSNRLLWIALLSLLILVFLSAIWSASRNRKIIRERFRSLEFGNSGKQPVLSGLSGIMTENTQSDYYTIELEQTIPESSIGKVHYHVSTIKTVYHLIQGALLERKTGDFGGYFFGNQYKLPGKGPAKSEIFIEKACDSKYLRSSISNNVNARADLVDELDELVRQNKKYRLIGWFASTADSAMEIPEGLMKIHRSFFREKWQSGILINPASDVLQGAGFIRRTSGYLDPLPDPAAFLKWDEMYRFALNPTVVPTLDTNGAGNQIRNYSQIIFNNTWGDSIVSAASFDQPVIAEIMAAAANQAIPKDNYQVVGYLYGTVKVIPAAENKSVEYEVFVDRFLELGNESAPREIPGMALIGWWGQSSVDVISYLQDAIDYHENTYREAYQISCLVNPAKGELRIFTRKHSLEMNNSTIETEEYSIMSLLSH